MDNIRQTDCNKWNFDFYHESSFKGRYDWKKVTNDNNNNNNVCGETGEMHHFQNKHVHK